MIKYILLTGILFLSFFSPAQNIYDSNHRRLLEWWQDDNNDNTDPLNRQAFLTIGNSIDAGINATPASTLPTAGTAFEFDRNTNTILNFGVGAGIVGYSNNSKSPWAKFCIDYFSNTSYKPVIINRGASSSTASPASDNNDWQSTGNNYNLAVTAANTCLQQMNISKLKAILIGEILINDVQGLNGTNVYTVSQIQTYLFTLITNLRTEFGNDVPIIFNTPGRTAAITTSAKLSGCRNAIRQASITFDNVYIGASLSSFTVGALYLDNIHPNTLGNDHLGAMFARWFINSNYTKWARAIISCHFHELTTLQKNKIQTWLDSWQSAYLQMEYGYLSWKGFLNASKLNASFDWSFMSAPIVDGNFTVSADSHIATNGTTQFFDDGNSQVNSAIFITQNDYLEGIKIKANSTPGSTSAFAFGVSQSSPATSLTYLRQSSAILYACCTNTIDSNVIETQLTAGRWGISMNSGTIRQYKNGVQVDNASIASVTMSTLTSYVGALNNAGTAAGFLNAQFEWKYKIKLSAISDISLFETALITLQN